MKYALIISLLVVICSCSKDKEYCWDVYDALGNQLPQVCGKTEKEIAEQYGNNYDRSDVPRYCWKVFYSGSPDFSYVENYSEKRIVFYTAGALSREKVPCGYCQKWLHRQKNLYKPSGTIHYSSIRNERFCGDTCSTLFPGRIILLRETADSLITVEILQKL